jgi:hypothetical protein
MSYIKVDLSKPSGISAGAGSGKDTVIVIDAEDVLVFPPRDGNKVRMLGNFVFKPNTKMYKIYTTKSKGEAPVESDGDEDSVTIKQMFNTQHPGNKLEAKEFVQNWLGKNVYILHKGCADDFFEVMGTPCAPLQLKPSKTDGNDARFWALKFEAFAKSSFLPGQYEGEVITEVPTAVADPSEFDIDTAVNSQYKLAATSAATSVGIAGVDANDGDFVTLIGSGGSTAATLETLLTGPIMVALKNSTTWTALDGAVIQFQVFKAGATTLLLELSRS